MMYEKEENVNGL